MHWTRQDSGYAGAVLGAAALAGWLVAANFGLRPPPSASTPREPPPPTLVPAVEVPVPTPAPAGPPEVPVRPRELALEHLLASVPTRPPAAEERRDTLAPVAEFTTPDGAVLVLAPVTGTVADDLAGVASVTVTFQPLAGPAARVGAELRCEPGGLRCTWSARPPALVGQYRVSVQATDLAGNTAPSRWSITVLAASLPPPGGLARTVAGALSSLL